MRFGILRQGPGVRFEDGAAGLALRLWHPLVVVIVVAVVVGQGE